LDTPIVTRDVVSDALASLASQSLGALFAATDPANRAITSWQVYDTATSDSLVFGGIAYSDHAATDALTASTLAAISLRAGSAATTDTLEVRAYNGSYWGDWTSLNITVGASAPVRPSAPVLQTQTANQSWLGGKPITLALPSTTFKDPQNEALTYTAVLSNGQALPSWLKFNAATDTFSGTAPLTAQALTIKVTATDTNGLSASDSFSATVIGAPVVASQTPNQTWTAGKAFSLALPANTFTDPQGERLAYTATQQDGQALPSWLRFNAATDTFSGTAPATAQTVEIKATATDTSGLAVSENFAATVQPAAAPTGIAVTAPTPNQTWTDGQAADLRLPANTFTDALGLPMRFLAYEMSGPNVTSWLHFNPTSQEFFGSAPASMSGTVQLAVFASDARQQMTAEDLFSVTFAPASSAHTQLAHAAFGVAAQVDPAQVAGLLTVHT
jgi:hypothetical protein